jgi:ribosomal protein S15P/S13E
MQSSLTLGSAKHQASTEPHRFVYDLKVVRVHNYLVCIRFLTERAKEFEHFLVHDALLPQAEMIRLAERHRRRLLAYLQRSDMATLR